VPNLLKKLPDKWNLIGQRILNNGSTRSDFSAAVSKLAL